MRTIVLSNNLEIREDLHNGKSLFLDKLNENSVKYVDGFVKIIYFNFFDNQRKDIFPYLNDFFDIKKPLDDVFNPYYHHIRDKYHLFTYKKWYNALQREHKTFFSQISRNFIGYSKYILKNINSKINYKDNKIIIYKPRNNGKTESLIIDSKTILDKIKSKLHDLGLDEKQIEYFIINEIKLLEKTGSDTILLDINDEKFNNIKFKKYYFRDDNEDDLINVDLDLLKKDKAYLIKLMNELNLTRFIYKKFNCPRISKISIPLSEFFGVTMEKEGLNKLLGVQLIKDKSIGN